MSIHLHKFVDRVRGLEARGGRDLVMNITDARDLMADITRLLIDLHHVKQSAPGNNTDTVVTINMDGGAF